MFEINRDVFIKSYWNYYLDLEEQLIATKRFVDFNKNNEKTFSIEYLKLLQATCSEIDVVAKIMAEYFDNEFKMFERKDIQKWGWVIQRHIADIEKITVTFSNDWIIVPWENWKYEHYQDKRGNNRYRLLKGKSTPEWWTAYNKVKHERTSNYKNGQTNYVRANLGNLLSAMAALFILETVFLDRLVDDNVQNEKSKLFLLMKNNEKD